MKTETVEVKMKGEVVDVIEVPVCEDEDDLATLELSLILACVNRQRKADMANAARSKHREKTPGKGKRYSMGLNELMMMTFSDGETGVQKLQAIAADASLNADQRKEKMDSLILSKEVQEKVSAALGEVAA